LGRKSVRNFSNAGQKVDHQCREHRERSAERLRDSLHRGGVLRFAAPVTTTFRT
jgi:hypothetical protein